VNINPLYENILEEHKRWKTLLIIVVILAVNIIIFGTIAGIIARDLASDEGDLESKLLDSIPITYFFSSLLLAGFLTFIVSLLYEEHIKKIPEIWDENLKSILLFYSISLGVFFLSFITSIGILIPYVPIAFLAVIITFNILLIEHSKKIERAIEEVSKVRSYHAHQASSIHHQLESDRKYCSTCQYPLEYKKINNRYYCEVCKKFDQ
jgi:MFS family permease